MKRSTNFRGRPGKHLTPGGLAAALAFVGKTVADVENALPLCANCGQPKASHPVSPELQCPEFKPK